MRPSTLRAALVRRDSRLCPRSSIKGTLHAAHTALIASRSAELTVEMHDHDTPDGGPFPRRRSRSAGSMFHEAVSESMNTVTAPRWTIGPTEP